MIKDASPKGTTQVVASNEKDFDNFEDARDFIQVHADMGHPVRVLLQSKDGVDKYRCTVYTWRTA